MANEYWVVAYDSGELAEAATSVTISGLSGDTDEEYELITRVVNGYNGAIGIYIRPNNDTGANYGEQNLYASNTTITASRDASSAIWIGYPAALGNLSFTHTKIHAKSGYQRTTLTKKCTDVTGTTVGYVWTRGDTWTNTADEITSLVIFANQTNGLGIGSRIILLKKASTGTPAWQQVTSGTLTEAATSVTISSLTGDTDVVYRLTCRVVSGTADDHHAYLQLAGDTDANYGSQRLNANNTTVSASRGPNTCWTFSNDDWFATDVGDIGMIDCLIYAKSGYLRTGISTCPANISTTTVTDIQLAGHTWNDTSTEVTSIRLFTGNSPTILKDGLGIGTYYSLEKLAL